MNLTEKESSEKEISLSMPWRFEGVTVFQSQVYQMNSALIETPDLLLLVDPGYLPSEIEEIRRLINEKQGARPLFLVFTHSNGDHIIGASFFPEAYHVGSASMKEADGQKILRELKEFDQAHGIVRADPLVFPRLEIEVGDDQIIQEGLTELLFLPARGHTNDGIFTIVSPPGIFIAGDYLSDIEFPFIYFSFREYEKTIERAAKILLQHSVRVLVPGHGSATADPEEMKSRAVNDARYLSLLKETILCGDLIRAQNLLEELRYPSSLKEDHWRNIQILKREFGLEA